MSKPFCKGPVAYPLHYSAYINPIGYHTLEFYTIKRGGRLKDVAKATGVPLKELEKTKS